MLYLLSIEGSLLVNVQDNVLFGVAMLVLFGLLGGKLIERIKFPKVTGYIIIGILIGPSVLSILSFDMVESFTIIRQVAIGVIGYTIGLELKFRKLKKTGKQVTIITISQALATAIFVCLAIVSYLTITGGNHVWTYGLVLGAIATATAPGPIVAIVKSYRTKGPVTDVLLPLVALDDAIGIMLFAVMLSIGTTLLGAGEALSAGALLLEPLKEIVLSFGIGAILGLAMTFTLRLLHRDDDKTLMMIILGFVFLGIGLGQVVHASAILLPMTIGIVFTNMIDEKFEHRLSGSVDLFAAPILLGFFTIAGAELNLSLLLIAGAMGIVYIVFRVLGNVTGAYISAKAVKAPPTVVKYLGFTLIPQAGVAIDMALTAELRFEEMAGFAYIGMEIMTIVLAATVIYEVFGLIIVKTALARAGEIDVAKTSWSSQQKV